MEPDESLRDNVALDDEIDEDPSQDVIEMVTALGERELRRRVKKLIERWRNRGSIRDLAYAYELEKTLK